MTLVQYQRAARRHSRKQQQSNSKTVLLGIACRVQDFDNITHHNPANTEQQVGEYTFSISHRPFANVWPDGLGKERGKYIEE